MEIIDKIKVNILNPIMGLMFAFAIVTFLYGVYEMVAGADNDDQVTKGKQHIAFGLLGIFIMVSAFGILNIICNSIGC